MPALPGAAPRSTELQEAELQTEEPHIIEPLRVTTTGGASSAVVVQGRLVTNTRDAPFPEAATPALSLSGVLERDTVSLDEQRLGCIAHIAARRTPAGHRETALATQQVGKHTVAAFSFHAADSIFESALVVHRRGLSSDVCQISISDSTV